MYIYENRELFLDPEVNSIIIKEMVNGGYKTAFPFWSLLSTGRLYKTLIHFLTSTITGDVKATFAR